MDNPLSGMRQTESDGWMDEIRARWWASLIVMVLLWAILSAILLPVVGLIIDHFVAAVFLSPLLGLAAAGGIGHWLGLIDPVDEARRRAPLWARVLVPIPVFVLLWFLFLIPVGSLVTNFMLMAGATTLLALAVTGAGVWMLGLFSGVTSTVRDTKRGARLGLLTLAGLLTGLVVFTAIVIALNSVPIALAAFLPCAVLAGVGIAFLSGWQRDAYEQIVAWHYGIRLGVFLVLVVLLTVYVAVLVGPFIPDARFAYAVAIAAALAVLVPVTIAVGAWRDAWQAYTSLEEGHRMLTLLPVFPLAGLLVFGLVAILSDSFEAAFIVSVPAGIAALLALGYPLGLTQRIPPMMRQQNLPVRSVVFLAAFALISVYAYFAIALVIQNLEIALVAGMAFAGLVLGGLNWAFDLGRGMGEEFETYGAAGGAAVLVAVFAATLSVVFISLALATGDFRLAFLVSVVAALGLNYLIAHTTGLVESVRTLVGRVPWWGDLLILGAAFLGVGLFATLAAGLFVPLLPVSSGALVPIATTIGVIAGLASIVFLSRDLAIGDDVMESAERQVAARAVVLVLCFLASFLAGLYATAGALAIAGVALFGIPLLVALLTGSSATIALARVRGWDREVLSLVRSGPDKLKVVAILAAWLGLGILTGFGLTALPFGAADLGIGSSSSLPLTLALAAGLVFWIWLPVALFKGMHVQRGPARVTMETHDRARALVSAGWGLLVFAVVLVVVLSIFNSALLALGVGLAAGYLVALLISTRGPRDTVEDT